MDPRTALDVLGFTLPSTAYLAGAVVFGAIGFVAFGYGRKVGQGGPKWIGLALMLYPYAIAQTWLLYLVGAVLCGALYFAVRG